MKSYDVHASIYKKKLVLYNISTFCIIQHLYIIMLFNLLIYCFYIKFFKTFLYIIHIFIILYLNISY